jgi:hypothetical protein
LQSLSFLVKQTQFITLNINVKKILDSIDLKKQDHIMSPNKEAMVLAQKIVEAFSSK